MKRIIVLVCLIICMCTPFASAQTIEKVNDNWTLGYLYDALNDEKSYYIEALGKHMFPNGEYYGDKSLHFRIYKSSYKFYFVIRKNNFPGHNPVIRIDDNRAITLKYFDDYNKAIGQLKGGKTAIIGYKTWPTGLTHMIVDIRGFDKAFGLLRAK